MGLDNGRSGCEKRSAEKRASSVESAEEKPERAKIRVPKTA